MDLKTTLHTVCEQHSGASLLVLRVCRSLSPSGDAMCDMGSVQWSVQLLVLHPGEVRTTTGSHQAVLAAWD